MSNQNKKFNSWEEEYLEMLKQDGYFTFCKKCARALDWKRNINRFQFVLNDICSYLENKMDKIPKLTIYGLILFTIHMNTSDLHNSIEKFWKSLYEI